MDPREKSGFISCVPRSVFIGAVYQLRLMQLRVRVLVGSRGQFSSLRVVYLAAEDKPNSSIVDGVQGSLFRCPSAALYIVSN
jgi:hypothetical protein